ncbi:MAG: ATP-binding protein, partial [Anaerolinea sp.]|nr:ATP-binding protein [Anaerolinea sp.]
MPRLTNPYHADYADEDALPGVPFAGRRAVLGRLHHLLTSPGQPAALTVVGRRRLGKTALLRAFDGAFGDDFLGAYVPLRQGTGTETDFILALAQAITAGLIAHQLPVTRLAGLEPPGDDPRGWFRDRFLPAACGPGRPGRRIVLLLDDADRLAHALRSDRLPRDLPAWLAGLLEPPTALGCALTIDADFEDDLPILAPLADPTAVMRLELLSGDETRWLLTEPARGCYTVPDDCAAAVQRA